MQLHIVYLIKLWVIFYVFFVIYWFWWFLPEATSESHTFLFVSLPVLSQLHHFCYSAVTTVSKALHFLWQIIMLYVRNFLSGNKEASFLGVGKLGLIHYLVIFLCLFWNCLSVIKLNCLLLFLLILIILGLH